MHVTNVACSRRDGKQIICKSKNTPHAGLGAALDLIKPAQKCQQQVGQPVLARRIGKSVCVPTSKKNRTVRSHNASRAEQIVPPTPQSIAASTPMQSIHGEENMAFTWNHYQHTKFPSRPVVIFHLYFD